MMKCNCSKYQENIKKLDEVFVYAWVHGCSYNGLEFEYCPWCGDELQLYNDYDKTIIKS